MRLMNNANKLSYSKGLILRNEIAYLILQKEIITLYYYKQNTEIQ